MKNQLVAVILFMLLILSGCKNDDRAYIKESLFYVFGFSISDDFKIIKFDDYESPGDSGLYYVVLFNRESFDEILKVVHPETWSLVSHGIYRKSFKNKVGDEIHITFNINTSEIEYLVLSD